MKRISILVLCAVLLFALASCAGGEGGHQHTYGSDFKSNETHHWIGTTCTDEGCADVQVAKTAHVDSDGNKICDVCGYDAGHVHVYADDFSTDADKHWREALCGHDVAAADEAAHTAAANGVCTVCGTLTKVQLSTVEQAIALGKLWQSAVKWGEADVYYTDYVYGDGTPMLNDYIRFDYAENYAHFTNASGEYWAHLVGDDKLILIKDDGFEISRDEFNVSSAVIGGFPFDSAVIGGSDAFEAHGPVQILEVLYAFAKSPSAFGYSENIADGKFSFSFHAVNTDSFYLPYLAITVEFALGATYEIESISIKSDIYNATVYDDDDNPVENYLSTPVLDDNQEPALDEYGNPMFNYALTDASVLCTTYTYTIYQSVAEYDKLPYDPSDILASDYDLYYYDNDYNKVVLENGGNLDLKLGNDLYLYFENILPAGAILSLNSFTATVTDLDGELVYGVNAYASVTDGSIRLKATEAGSYVVTISGEACEDFVLNVTAEIPSVEYMSVKQLGTDVFEDGWGSQPYSTWTDIFGTLSAQTNVPLLFYSEFNSPYCNAAVNIVVTDIEGNTVSADDYVVSHGVPVEVGQPDYSGYYPSLEWVDTAASSISFSKAGTYTVTVTSVENAACAGTFEVEVSEAEVHFAGTWIGEDMFGNTPLTLVIDETAGTVTFTYTNPRNSNVTTTVYSYTITDGVVSLVNSENSPALPNMASLVLDANGNPVSAVFEMNEYTLSYSESSEGGDDSGETDTSLAGTYYVMGEMFILTFENGTLTVVDGLSGAYTGTYIYVVDNGDVTVTNTDGSACDILINPALGGGYEFQVPGLPMAQPLNK